MYKQKMRNIGQFTIYFVAKETIIIGYSIIGHQQYMLVQSWHERYKKPFQLFYEAMESSKTLEWQELRSLIQQYSLDTKSVTGQSVPLWMRLKQANLVEVLPKETPVQKIKRIRRKIKQSLTFQQLSLFESF